MKVGLGAAVSALLALATALLMLSVAPLAAADTFVVTQAGDPPPGACNANCSLREAIDAANAAAGPDRVKLGARTHRVRRSGDLEDANQTGDLDVLDDLTVIGRSAGSSVIDGEWSGEPDRLIEVIPSADLKLKRLTLRDGDDVEGAAIQFPGPGELDVTGVRVLSNESGYTAVNSAGDSSFSRVLFRGNTAECCPALYNYGGGEMVLRDVVFDRNRAADDTGAFYSSGNSAVLNRVTFSNNRAGDIGGGAMISSGGNTHVLRNVTFSGNSTTGLGGALLMHADVTLNNVTFFKNVADRDDDDPEPAGGAVAYAGGTAIMTNTILSGNTSVGTGADQCAGVSAVDSNGFNLIGPGGSCLFALQTGDVPAANPRLAPLAKNGGFAPSHALKRTSKARNKGSNQQPGSGGTSCEPRDQRGVKRPQGPRCDIGAFELKR